MCSVVLSKLLCAFGDFGCVAPTWLPISFCKLVWHSYVTILFYLNKFKTKFIFAFKLSVALYLVSGIVMVLELTPGIPSFSLH